MLLDEQVTTTPDTRLSEPGDHERLAHYAPIAQIESAIFNGTPCRALCGKVWTPTRDPQRFPVCPECRETWEGLDND